jgi:hypothetical protein
MDNFPNLSSGWGRIRLGSLCWQDDSLSPDAIYEALKAMAIDMNDPSTAGFDPGFDFGTGHGFIQADAALAEVASPH